MKQPVPPAILHIVSSSLGETPGARDRDQWIAQAGMEVAHCGDVYLGLARALSHREIGAVIVCVEDIAAEEFEFFSLVARARRDLAVLVYGPRAPERVVQALQTGAKGLATRDAVQSLRSRFERQTEPVDSPAVTPPAAARPSPCEAIAPNDKETSSAQASTAIATSSPVAPMVGPSADPHRMEQTEDVESEPREDAGPGATARVPWLRYSGGPERQRPSATKSGETIRSDGIESPTTDNAAARSSAAEASDRRYEPLLTEQELAALLADDLDDMASQEREMLTGGGEVPGSGTR